MESVSTSEKDAHAVKSWCVVVDTPGTSDRHVVSAREHIPTSNDGYPLQEGHVLLQITGVPLTDKLAWGDVVVARTTGTERHALFSHVAQHSGYVTAWVGLADDEPLPPAARSHLAALLKQRGFHYQCDPGGLLAVAVPMAAPAIRGVSEDPLGEVLTEALRSLVAAGALSDGAALGVTLVSLPLENGPLGATGASAQ